MFPADAEGQAALIASLARRAYPSLELFIFSLAAGALISFGYFVDSQALVLLGLLAAPVMTPWVGFLLALYSGSRRFFFETCVALLISATIVFLSGLLTGFAARLFLPLTFYNASVHARLWLPDLLTLAIGATTLIVSFARSEDKPFLPSILLVYSFYLPLSAGGFGLGANLQGVGLEGLLVFFAYFSLASLIGLATLLALRLKPTRAGGFFSAVAAVLFAALVIYLMYPQAILSVSLPSPTPQPSATLAPPPSPTFAPIATETATPTSTPTFTPAPTFTPTLALTASETPSPEASAAAEETSPAQIETPSALPSPAADTATASPTITPPTPLLGVINAGESGGANLRQVPKGKYITTLPNGAVVEVSSEKRVVDGVEWARVFATVDGNRLEGWLLASVLEYPGVTPSP